MIKELKLELMPILLVLFCLKCLFFSFSLNETFIVLGILSIIGIKTFLNNHKKLKDYDLILSKQNEVISKMATEVDAIKTSMVGLKMNQGFKKVV